MRRGARAAIACGVGVAVAATAWFAGAAADDAGVVAGAASHPVAVAVAAGRHDRLDTDRGPVHVWVPAGYHPDGAATVVYVHGYYTDVDAAWTNHRLAEQFALSGVNAVFVACGAPKGARDGVRWPSLGDLLATVHQRTGVARPAGPVVAVGHSGAFRTLIEWLDYPLLDVVVAIDAMYAEIEPFARWVEGSARRRFIDVTEDTVRWSEELARDLAAAGIPPVVVDRVPLDDLGWPDEARVARAVMVRAQWAHMPLVTDGIVIPQVLRLLGVEILPDAPWAHPLGDLPPTP